MAVNGGHAGTKKGPNWGHVTPDFKNFAVAGKLMTTFRFEPNFQKFRSLLGDGKKHINFLNINFLAPTQNPHFGPPEKKVHVPHVLGKKAKEAHKHKFVLGNLGV